MLPIPALFEQGAAADVDEDRAHGEKCHADAAPSVRVSGYFFPESITLSIRRESSVGSSMERGSRVIARW